MHFFTFGFSGGVVVIPEHLYQGVVRFRPGGGKRYFGVFHGRHGCQTCGQFLHDRHGPVCGGDVERQFPHLFYGGLDQLFLAKAKGGAIERRGALDIVLSPLIIDEDALAADNA